MIALKSALFNNQVELCQYAALHATTIYQIIYNQDGKYVLFYV